MKAKSVFVALGVMTTLALGMNTTVDAKSNQTSKKSKEKKEKVITVKTGDTLEAIAKKYGTTYTRLFNANKSIKHPDHIDVGDKVKIPPKGKKIKERQQEQPAQATSVAQGEASGAEVTQEFTSEPIDSNSYYVGNGMWCTDYVHDKRPDVAIYGNAGYNWINSAQAEGKSTGSTPKKGAVAVTNGHVAYVEKVNKDGSYVVSEMGWNYQAGKYNKRTVGAGSNAFGQFIY